MAETNTTYTSTSEDMTQYYNEGPFGPDGKERSLHKFFHTRSSPSGGQGAVGGSAFDQECKEFLKSIKEMIESGITPI